ncbi:hypothetical protein CPB83DRAFT_295730 [Crepidotus variabilis]|uniref:Uncharacterized protein n=1 Tax=Crepidotus variabilis TaxID=179855 RepID=A0A9P6EHA2_9AGAR|nr:hypothetical protein CPB83DRAFT_295730 [Crepidotus variabilis]
MRDDNLAQKLCLTFEITFRDIHLSQHSKIECSDFDIGFEGQAAGGSNDLRDAGPTEWQHKNNHRNAITTSHERIGRATPTTCCLLPGLSLLSRSLLMVEFCLGSRQIEWLFLICQNSWIIFRPVNNNDHPFLVYSPLIELKNLSEPPLNRAFLGAIFAGVNGVDVEPSVFQVGIKLKAVEEVGSIGSELVRGTETGQLIQGDIISSSTSDPSHETSSSKESTGSDPTSEQHITASPSEWKPEHQTWIHLRSMQNKELLLPQCIEGSNRRLFPTRFLGSGSTGNVRECRFDNSQELFAIKVVEELKKADKKKENRIAPRCYGFYTSEGMYVLIVDKCDITSRHWKDLDVDEQ